MKKILNYIDGKLEEPIDGLFLDNINPATGQVYSIIAHSNEKDIATAFSAAQNAFSTWRYMVAEERFKILNRIAEMIDLKKEDLALAESIDQGKPLWLARNEITRAGQNFRFFATASLQFSSESHSMDGRAINYTLRQPIGVVGCISPWNLPLYLFTWKIAPALATGNCVIAKPSEFTPVTAFMLAEICIEAGLPAGVLNIVQGLGSHCGQAIISHPQIKAISFTGGTSTGKHIAATAAPQFKKLSLELGGKNPNIIFADCNLEKAIKTTVQSSFLNQGEICLCGSRILVQKNIYQKFLDLLKFEVKQLIVGNPLATETKVGAIVSKPHFEKVLSYIALAKEEGGKIELGGNSIQPNGNENGFFIEPTIITELDSSARCNTEEIFGPVVTLIPFDTEEDAIQIANNTEYGLAATIWTENVSTAHRVAEKLQSGIVWVNCWLLRDLRTPFGGVKQSGVGREGGWEAMKFFTEAKNVCIAY